MDTYMYTRVQVSINVYVSVYVKRARRLQMEEEYMKGSEEEEEGSQDEVRGGSTGDARHLVKAHTRNTLTDTETHAPTTHTCILKPRPDIIMYRLVTNGY